MKATLTLRQVMGFADYLKRVDAQTRPTLAALHFARVDEKHARAYATDGFSAIVLDVDAQWEDDHDQTLSYSRDDLKLIVATTKANKMDKDFDVTFGQDKAIFLGGNMTRIFPAFFDHHDAPAHWASALVNCDYSGLTEQEKQEVRNFLERENLGAGSCVSCSGHSFIGKFDGLLTELFEYTFDTRKEFLP